MAPAKWLPLAAVAVAAAAVGVAGAPGSPGVAIAGYAPVTDVSEHARIDLDIRAIEEAETDYATALAVYTQGANSAKEDGNRTLQGFSTEFLEAGPAQEEPLAVQAQAFWGDWDYADRHLLAALAGNDSTTYGAYASGALAADPAARTQASKRSLSSLSSHNTASTSSRRRLPSTAPATMRARPSTGTRRGRFMRAPSRRATPPATRRTCCQSGGQRTLAPSTGTGALSMCASWRP